MAVMAFSPFSGVLGAGIVAALLAFAAFATALLRLGGSLFGRFRRDVGAFALLRLGCGRFGALTGALQ